MARLSNGKVVIVNMEQRPDLLPHLMDSESELVKIMGTAMGSLNGDTFVNFYFSLGDYPGFRKYLFAALRIDEESGSEDVIAYGKAVPLHWPDLSLVRGDLGEQDMSILRSLPDGGFSSVIAISVRQCLGRLEKLGSNGPKKSSEVSPSTDDQIIHWHIAQMTDPPNCISALEIVVLPQWRRQGVAEALLIAMRASAFESGFKLMFLPLRPTRKSDHPRVTMDEYITWKLPGGSDLPYDPWLRTHVRQGGKAIKIAPTSEICQGNAAQWAEVTGIDVEQECRKNAQPGQKEVDIYFPDCFNAMKWDTERKWGTYEEANIWVCHKTNETASQA